jgi:transposase-like protein
MNLIELTEKFPSELEAIQHFEKARWGKKPKCPYCDSLKVWKRSSDMRFLCKKCKNSFSVTVNTQLHNTRLPLKTWLFAFSIVSDAKKGVSALQLQRNLSISYPTAWAMGHKMRALMIIENDEIKLEGVVEMDETFIGGKPRKMGNPDYPMKKQPDLDEQIEELNEKGHKSTGIKRIPQFLLSIRKQGVQIK